MSGSGWRAVLLRWVLYVLLACTPFAVLAKVYSVDLIKRSTGYGFSLIVPDVLIADFAFIGVALFLSVLPEWLVDKRKLGEQRKFYLIALRMIVIICAVGCFIDYVLIQYEINELRASPSDGAARSFQKVLEHKSAMFWVVLGVVFSTLASSLCMANSTRRS